MQWKEEKNALVKEFTFSDFKEAWSFMCQVAELAEHHNHHPEWTNVYNKVRIKLTTLDADNRVTHKDRRLAESINSLIH